MKKKKGVNALLATAIILAAIIIGGFVAYTMIPPVHQAVLGLLERKENSGGDFARSDFADLTQSGDGTGGSDGVSNNENDGADQHDATGGVSSADPSDGYAFWDSRIGEIAENAASMEDFMDALPEDHTYHDLMLGIQLISERGNDEAQRSNARNKQMYQRLAEQAAEGGDSCTIQEVRYTVTGVSYHKDLSELGISIEDTIYAGTDFDFDQYIFAAVNLSIENTGDSTIKDVNCNPFSYLFLSDDYIINKSDSTYATWQPGEGTHKYFAVELSPGEKAETTSVFVIPENEEFYNYRRYVCVSTMDISDYSGNYMGLIALPQRQENE